MLLKEVRTLTRTNKLEVTMDMRAESLVPYVSFDKKLLKEEGLAYLR